MSVAPITASWLFKGERQSYTIDSSVMGHEEIGPITVAGSTTDYEVALAIDVSDLDRLIITSDGKDITIETNSGSAADDTLTIKNGRPFIWKKDDGFANPLGTDVTSIFITNSGAGSTIVRIIVDQDHIP